MVIGRLQRRWMRRRGLLTRIFTLAAAAAAAPLLLLLLLAAAYLGPQRVLEALEEVPPGLGRAASAGSGGRRPFGVQFDFVGVGERPLVVREGLVGGALAGGGGRGRGMQGAGHGGGPPLLALGSALGRERVQAELRGFRVGLRLASDGLPGWSGGGGGGGAQRVDAAKFWC